MPSITLTILILFIAITISIPAYSEISPDPAHPGRIMNELPQVDETDRIPYQTGWPITYTHSQALMGESIIPTNIVHNDFQLEIALLDANMIQVWNHDAASAPGWGFSGSTPRGVAVHSKYGGAKIAVSNLNTSASYMGLILYDYLGQVVDGWPRYAFGGVQRSPMFADLEYDGVPEIVGGTDLDEIAYVINQDGSDQDGWPIDLGGFTNGFAAGNLDNEGTQEIVFYNSIWTTKRVWVVDNDGNIITNWTVPANVSIAVEISPVLVDLNGDQELEIVVVARGQLFCYARTGQLLWTYNTVIFDAEVSQVAAGDIDGDGTNEICFSTDNRLYVLNSEGRNFSAAWPLAIRDVDFLANYCISSGPAVADINGDNLQEIIISIDHPNGIHLAAFDRFSNMVRGFPIRQGELDYVEGTPAIADLDLDGDVEICCWGRENPNHTISHIYVYDLPAPYDFQYCDWPMIQQNPWRNSCLPAENTIDGNRSGLAVDPEEFMLTTYPNPFNTQAGISFELAEPGEVELTVFDVSGREVVSLVTDHLSLGMHEYLWDAEGMGSGVYFARLTLQSAGTLQHSVKKMLLVK